METVDIVNLIMLACFGYAIFNLGQCWAIMRIVREEDRQHRRAMKRILEARG